MLPFLDGLLLAAHASLTLFNLSGWAWRRIRRVHLFVLGATLFCWIAAGLVYGYGYCPLTDWHWRVKQARGAVDLPGSWIKYYADRISGLDWPPVFVDASVAVVAVTAFVLSAVLNWRDRRRGPQGRLTRTGT